MKTVSSCVEAIVLARPFLEEGLSKEIINYSALAKVLQDDVSAQIGRPIKTGAIMMALRRYNDKLAVSKSYYGMSALLGQLGDITLRSNLSDFTFKNSNTLINSHSTILNKIKDKSHIFFTFTRGILESNIIISSSENEDVLKSFKGEDCLDIKENLSAISLILPKNNTKIAGLYYQILKRLAWENVSLYEVISTTNEFTLVVEDAYVDSAFSIIKNLNKS
jgi:aspartokinase